MHLLSLLSFMLSSQTTLSFVNPSHTTLRRNSLRSPSFYYSGKSQNKHRNNKHTNIFPLPPPPSSVAAASGNLPPSSEELDIFQLPPYLSPDPPDSYNLRNVTESFINPDQFVFEATSAATTSSSYDSPLFTAGTTTTNNNNKKKPYSNKDSLSKFTDDITTVFKVLKAEGQDPDIPKLFRNIQMPSFTNVWSQKDWDRHTSRWRYLKYLLAFPTSRLLRRIAPQLLICVVWSCIACWMCSRECQGILSKAVLPLTPLSLVSTFVAGLLTLRSNQGLSRLNEGRLAFGKVVLYTRDMAQLIATLVYPKNKQLGLLAARHVAMFGWLLKDFLRHYDEDYTRPLDYRPSVCHETNVIRTMLPTRVRQRDATSSSSSSSGSSNLLTSVDARYILQQRKKPVAVVTRLRQIFNHMNKDLSTSEQSRLDACAQHLNRCIMVCERIRASPIPPLYTAHAGRLLMFYIFFLPLALRGSQMLDSVGTIITTTAVSYAMLGLDEISHILEEPFRLMPLYHLSKNSMNDVADAMVCAPPPLPIEDDYEFEKEMTMEEIEHDEDSIQPYW